MPASALRRLTHRLVAATVIAAGLFGLLVLAATLFSAAVWLDLPSRTELRRLAWQASYAPVLLDRDGHPLGPAPPGGYYMDSVVAGPYLRLDELPGWFVDDLKFGEGWGTPGFSLRGLVRALVATASGHRQGASTIQMQVVQMLLRNKRDDSFARKLWEIPASMKLHAAFTEAEILAFYVNNATFVQGGHAGLAYATWRVFGKPPADLSRAEGILLLSFLPRPARSAPANHAARRAAYHTRLASWRRAGRITADEQAAWAEPPAYHPGSAAPTFDGVWRGGVVAAARQLLQASGSGWQIDDALQIETTLDASVNEAAGRALEQATRHSREVAPAFVLLDPSAEVLAYVVRGRSRPGDLDLLASRATQPASRIKVLAYGLAIDALLRQGLTPAQVMAYPLAARYHRSDGAWITDAGLAGRDTVSLQEALIRSLNGPTYHLCNRLLTPAHVAGVVARFGASIPAVESVCMGNVGLSEVDLAAITHSLVVRRGVVSQPRSIRRIVHRPTGTILFDATEQPEEPELRIVSAPASRMLHQLLRAAIRAEGGTSQRLLQTTPCLDAFDVGSKTGTSSGSRYKYRGVTGVLGSHTFSLALQGTGARASASTIAVPVAAAVLGRLTCTPDAAP